MSKRELTNLEIENNNINRIIDNKNKLNLEKYYSYIIDNKIDIICCTSIDYPKKLKEIKDSPCFIYVRGNKSLLYEDSVAIVGSRNATEYGRSVARIFAKEIADKNVNIISGLAIRNR